MLVLTRRLGESIIIGDDIITVLNKSKGQVYLDVNISESLTINLLESASIRENITVTAVKIDKNEVKLGISCPSQIFIWYKVLVIICQHGIVLSTFSWISGNKFIGIKQEWGRGIQLTHEKAQKAFHFWILFIK